ncbi:hypothetical protein CAOG_010062 [Capsaspora owczarzaki ATCC 30864]|uniref:DDB1- and CUL4-associated factor 13 n=1 Tax=Capsaspora owczarzaki (strain ATCC 30864) TaxID=595528 RepID=A0A0D2WVK0_CAPO3|nr:hypothetical protein CAOG_010062 [Capsaspora owczarzaki ATCC 30864]
MRVKAMQRGAEHLRETLSDLPKLQRNIDPKLHPFEQAREYTRALNATKLERVFAKPFVGALSGHTDGVFCMAKHPLRISSLLSGSCDGEIRLWNLVSEETIRTYNAHQGFVRGVCISPLGDYFISVGDDKHIKQWRLDYDAVDADLPINAIITKNSLTGCDHHRKDSQFATSGSVVELWDVHRSDPISTYSWGADTVTTVRFNPVETNILATCGSDRNIALYDIRGNTPMRKVILGMRSNAIAWNPMEAFNFTSVRIYRMSEGHSRDIYHTKRMQRIFTVKWSSDSKFIFCGSDETNIRIWKAEAAEKLGTLLPRERAALEYADKLKDSFKHHPAVKRIARHRHVPKAIHSAQKEKRIMVDARKTKEGKVRAHSKPGSVPFKIERKKHIVTQVK